MTGIRAKKPMPDPAYTTTAIPDGPDREPTRPLTFGDSGAVGLGWMGRSALPLAALGGCDGKSWIPPCACRHVLRSMGPPVA
jgi:hypothetical protein